MSNLQNIISGLQSIGTRPAPYSEQSVEIKNKIYPKHSRTGVLGNFHINDIVTARKDITQFFTQNGRNQETILSQLQHLQPRVAPVVDEDDPFI